MTARAGSPAAGKVREPVPRHGLAPGTWRISVARARVEVLLFFREKDSVIFTFLLPIAFLVLFSSVFPGEIAGVDSARYFTAGFVAAGIAASSFQTLGITIAIERDDGTLKRLRGTPMPPVAYLVGKLAMVLAVSLCQLAILLTLATVAFGVPLPSATGWLTFAWVFGLGIATCALLGIAISSLPRSGKSASPVVTFPFLILQFISGVFFVFSELPQWLQEVAAVFPLKWMTQGLRSVFLPDRFAEVEPAGAWELGRVALVLSVWLVVGLVLALRTFRWTRRGDT